MKNRKSLWIIITSLVISFFIIACESASGSTDGEESFPPEEVTLISLNTWADGLLSSANSAQWFSFTATDSTQYIHFKSGTLSSVAVQLYDSNGNKIGSKRTLTGTSPYEVSPSSGKYYLKITNNSSSDTGTFQILFSATTSIPMSPDEIHEILESATALTLDGWARGDITDIGEKQWYKFEATSDSHYVHFKKGALIHAYIQLYDSTGNAIEDREELTSSNTSKQYTDLTSGQTYCLRVTPNTSETGNYRIGFTENSVAPGVLESMDNATSLTLGEWEGGNIIAEGEERWYKFEATADTHYVHFKKDILDNITFQLYDSTGNLFGDLITYYNSDSTECTSLTSGQTYYIKATPLIYTKTGTFEIGYTVTSGEPGTLEAMESAVTLTIDEWKNGFVPITGEEQWYKFEATNTSHYVHFKEKGVGRVYIQLYNASANKVDTQAILDDSRTSKEYNSLTTGQTYYIKVTPRYDSDRGSFQISCTETIAEPGVLTAMETAISLTVDEWTDGNIPDEDGEQWFSFEATANSHYVHFKHDELSEVYFQLYDATGTKIGDQDILHRNNPYKYYPSLTNGHTYYIRIIQRSISTGSYKIGFTVISGEPGTQAGIEGAAALTLDTWTSGSIDVAGGEDWYKFEATADTHYVHFKKDTLREVYVQLYDGTGSKIGDHVKLDNYDLFSTDYESLTNGETYYLKVVPYSSTGTGAYEISVTEISGEPGTLAGIASAISLTFNTWKSGTIDEADGENWYKFEATTADTHRVHIKVNTGLYVQLYDSEGYTIDDREYFYDNDSRLWKVYYSLASGETYAIKVTTVKDKIPVAFEIAFNDSSTPPDE